KCLSRRHCPLAVIGLVLPDFTVSSPGPTFSRPQAAFLIIMSLGLYGVFLAIQTSRHRRYFIAPTAGNSDENSDPSDGRHEPVGAVMYHLPLLVAYLLAVVMLANKIAVPIDYGIHVLGAPPALGGFIVSVLVMFPEAIAAVRAALQNRL